MNESNHITQLKKIPFLFNLAENEKLNPTTKQDWYTLRFWVISQSLIRTSQAVDLKERHSAHSHSSYVRFFCTASKVEFALACSHIWSSLDYVFVIHQHMPGT